MTTTSRLADVVDAQRAFALAGTAKDIGFRRARLRQLKEALKASEQRLLDALHADLGKSPFESCLTEIGVVHHEIDDAIANVRRWSRPRHVTIGLTVAPATSWIIPEPYGTTLIIGAWNYPLQLTLAPLVAAIAAGNTAIVKPSELAAHSSSALADVLNATFDADYVHVIEGGIDETSALLAHRFDKIFFTGSTAVGRIVAKAAAEHLTPVTLELGGKSPCFVLADADIAVAARRISWGKYLNAGQTCVAPDYVLVERSVHDALLAELAAQIAPVAGTDPRNSDSFGRIVNRRHVERLRRLIDPAKIHAGGEISEDERFVAPTILRDVDWSDPVMQEEIFGPILPVIAFDHLDDAIAAVKARPKPLALYAFTRSKTIEQRLLSSIAFGGGCINDVVMHVANPRLPFGGVGESGMGSYHSEAGFRAFSHYKSVLRKPTGFELPVRYPPYSPWKFRLLRWLFG